MLATVQYIETKEQENFGEKKQKKHTGPNTHSAAGAPQYEVAPLYFRDANLINGTGTPPPPPALHGPLVSSCWPIRY